MSLLDAFLLESYRVNVWLAVRTDGIAGSGSMSDPYDASTAATFDALMDGFAEYTQVNLGPGEFQTNGYCDESGGWQPKAGMKIVGITANRATPRTVAETAAHNRHLSERALAGNSIH